VLLSQFAAAGRTSFALCAGWRVRLTVFAPFAVQPPPTPEEELPAPAPPARKLTQKEMETKLSVELSKVPTHVSHGL